MARRMGRIVLIALAIAAVVLGRRGWNHIVGRRAPGGILIADPGAYDLHSRLLFGSLFREIAADVATMASPSAGVLEVGCGPGHLSIRLARDYGLDVSGLDLDPAMIERARANAARRATPGGRTPTFVVGDVAALPFADASFDFVVSTFSMHHWSDPAEGLREIHRVLRPGGRALIWDLQPGFWLFHAHAHARDPAEVVRASPLQAMSVRPWRWPWRLSFSQRLELARD
jgi:SAM-dependent methyltransferase